MLATDPMVSSTTTGKEYLSAWRELSVSLPSKRGGAQKKRKHTTAFNPTKSTHSNNGLLGNSTTTIATSLPSPLNPFTYSSTAPTTPSPTSPKCLNPPSAFSNK